MNNTNVATSLIDNVVPIHVVKKEVKLTKEGEAKMTRSNKEAGRSSEVYPIKSDAEIRKIMKVLNNNIKVAQDKVESSCGKPLPIKQLRNAYRNKLIWLVGMNIGIRASDFLELKWSFFFDLKDGEVIWHDFYSLQPQKQRKQGKFVKLFFNNTLKNAIVEYLSAYPIDADNIDSYMFTNDKGNHITTQQLWNVICDTAEEAGLKQNVGTHTLRKTWAYHCWHNANDKNKALIILQKCFNHASPQTTMGYIGIMVEEIEEMYLSVELGGNN